jgi:ABC-type antimicrobial peptide transport system permease subunit
MDGDTRALRIVGVVGDVREFGLETQPSPLLYALNVQRPRSAGRFNVIVRGPSPSSVAAPAQRIARELAPDVPVQVRTVSGMLDQALSGRRFNLVIVASFATVALLLAMIGVYGLVANFAAQRRREFGIRAALGARSFEIARLVVGESVALAVAGIVIGLGGAFALTRLMRQQLYGVTPTDPVAYASVAAVMIAAVMFATYVPARRATKATPVAALRSD